MFNYNDKFSLSCRSMLIYYPQCKNREPSEAHIGKTVNSVYERFFASGTGHLSTNNKNSALIALITRSTPTTLNVILYFMMSKFWTLDLMSYDEQITFVESILLKYDKQNLNTCECSIDLLSCSSSNCACRSNQFV